MCQKILDLVEAFRRYKQKYALASLIEPPGSAADVSSVQNHCETNEPTVTQKVQGLKFA